MSQVIVARNKLADSLSIWDSNGQSLFNLRSFDFDSGPAGAAVSPDNKWLAISFEDNSVRVFALNEGDIDAASPNGTSAETAVVEAIEFAKHDPSLLAMRLGSRVRVYRVGSGGTLTFLSEASQSFNIAGGTISWSTDGARIVAAIPNDLRVWLLSWDGSNVTSITTANFGVQGDASLPRFLGDSKKAFVGNTGASNIKIIDTTGDVLTQLASQAFSVGKGDQKPSPDGKLVAAGRRDADGKSKLFNVENDTFTDLADFPRPVRHPAWFPDNATIAGADRGPDGTLGFVFSWDGSSLTKLDEQVMAGSDEEIVEVLVAGEFGPTTPEQKFNASYADASAADPKATALIRPEDVQRSIDTDVSNLAGGPNLYVVEAIFDIGELQNLNPYNPTTEKPRVFFVKDDQPGLRQGKNLLLKSYTIRDADPSVPVTCTFWGY